MVENIADIRKILKRRLNQAAPVYEEQRRQVSNLLQRCVELGESNSALIFGPRKSGKSTLVHFVLDEFLAKSHNILNSKVVLLNGLIHTDEKLSLKSIARQLTNEKDIEPRFFHSLADNLTFILDCLKADDPTRSKCIIFVLDEFDLFASHHNQSLLYNLFDVAQSAQTPICVIGLTCRLDAVELLEKRVKSRFNHRQIQLFDNENQIDHPAFLRQLLTLPQEAPLNKSWIKSWNAATTKALTLAMPSLNDWFALSSGFENVQHLAFELISHLDDDHPAIDASLIHSVLVRFQADDKVLLLKGLSVLEVCLLIAIKHHSQIYDRDPFNFEIVYSRFVQFAQRNMAVQGVERDTALKAYEQLKELELITPICHSATKQRKEFQLHKLSLTYGQIDHAIQQYQNLPTDISQWALSSIV